MAQIQNPAAPKSWLASYMPKHRLAVSVLFLIHGIFMGAWSPKIPEFADRLGLTPFTLGLVIFAFGIGSLVMMPIGGIMIAHYGSATVTKITALLFTTTLLWVTLAPNIVLGVIAVFVLGGFTGAFDVAMNSNAVEVEKSMRRAIMSSCHAYWSVGAFIGASSGGILMQLLTPLGHVIVLTVLALVLVFSVWGIIMPDAPHPTEHKEKARLPMAALPWLIGMVALFSMIPEGSAIDWGAYFLRQDLNASVALSGFGFGCFAFAMSIMRFAGDSIRDRFGAVTVMRYSTVAAIVGLLSIGLAPNVPVALIGFAIAGLGISNMVPIAFSAAGNLPGYARGVALSLVTFLGYSGSLFAPSIIGFIAEHTGFRAIYLGLPALLLVVLALSSLVRYADGIKE